MPKQVAAKKDSAHRGMPDGLPDWIAPGPDALMKLLPPMNREGRRKLISQSKLAPAKKESDQSVLYRVYCEADSRFSAFWHHADVAGTTYKTNAPPSLEMGLLDKLELVQEETFTEAQFAETFPEADRVREHLKKIRPQGKKQRGLPAAGLNYLAKWKWAVEALPAYPRLNQSEKEAVRTIVFCTATIIGSAHVIERALELAPDLAPYFDTFLVAQDSLPTDPEIAAPTAMEPPPSGGPLDSVAEIGRRVGEFFDDLLPKSKRVPKSAPEEPPSESPNPEDWSTAFEALRNVASRYLATYPSNEEKADALQVMDRARELLQRYEPESPFKKLILAHLEALKTIVEADLAGERLGLFADEARASLDQWLAIEGLASSFNFETEQQTGDVVARMGPASEKVRNFGEVHAAAEAALAAAQATRPPVPPKTLAALKKNRNNTDNDWSEAQQRYLEELRYSGPTPPAPPPEASPAGMEPDTALPNQDAGRPHPEDPENDETPTPEPEQHSPTSPASSPPAASETAPVAKPPPTPPQDSPTAALHPSPPTGTAPLLEQRVWEAVRAGRIDAAYQLLRLTKLAGESVPASLPSETLLRSVVLSRHLHDPEGEIAQSLQLDLATLLSEFDDSQVSENAASQVLLWGALLRPILFAPDTVAHELVDRLSLGPELTTAYEFIVQLRELAKEVFYQRIDGRYAFQSLRNDTEWAAKTNELRQKLREWMDRETTSMLKFGKATELWHDLVDKGKPIADYFDRITVDRLESASISREMDELPKTFNDWKHLVSVGRINGVAGERLRYKLDAAREIAEEWLQHHRARPDPGGHLATRLLAIREFVESQQKPCRDALMKLSRGASTANAAAANALLELDRFQQLVCLQSSAPAADPRPQALLGRPLVEFTDCPVDAEWSLEPDADPLSARNSLLENGCAPRNPDTVMAARLASEDLLGADLYLATLRELDPVAESGLRHRHEQDSRDFWDRWERNCRQARERIEILEIYGLLSDEDRKSLNEKLEIAQLAQNKNAKARSAKRALEEIEATERNRLAEKRQELRRRLDLVERRISRSQFEFVSKALSSDDLASTQEYLARIESGEEIEVSDMLEGVEFENFQSGEIREKLSSLLQSQGGTPSPKFIDEPAANVGLDCSWMADTDRRSSKSLLASWQETRSVRDLPSGDGFNSKSRAIREVLLAIGFESVSVRPTGADQFREGHDLAMECQPIRDRRICPAPHFGSLAAGHYRLLVLFGAPSAEQVLQRARGPHVTSQRPIIVLYCGVMSEKFRKDIAYLSRKRRVSLAILDDALVVHLAVCQRSRLAEFFAMTVPLTWSNPYVLVGGGELPPEVYFGREHELDKVLDRQGSTFIYGGRQLGKTALLHKARQQFHNPDEGQYATYIDLKAVGVGYLEALDSRAIWSPIHARLRELGIIPGSMGDPGGEPSEEKIVALIQAVQKHFTSTNGRRLIVLLDEADRFLESDARRGYRETGRIKGLMEDTGRQVKFVFAGLHDVLRSAEQANHPFAHFGEPIRIRPMSGPEDWRDARRLVTGPLAAAGLKFKSVGLVDRILAQTNFYPNLIQLYCSHLLERMSGAMARPSLPLQEIGEENLDQTYIEQSLREEIRRKFAATLQLDPRYSLIAHVIAHQSYEANLTTAPYLSTRDLSDQARGFWPEALETTTEFGFSVLLEEMVSLGVLRRDETGSTNERRYSLRNRNMQLLMGSRDEVESYLIETNRPPIIEFMAKDMYPEYPGSNMLRGRAPISIEQLGHLLKEESGPVVLLGTKAAGIRVIPQFLRDYVSGRSSLPKRKFAPIGGVKMTESTDFEPALRDIIRKSNLTVTSDSLLICVNAETPWRPEWLQIARDATRKLPKPCRVVFFGGPDLMDCDTLATLGDRLDVPVLTLGPLTENGFRYLCGEANVPDTVEAVAMAEAMTGLWQLRALTEGEPLREDDVFGKSEELVSVVNLVHRLSQGSAVRLSEIEEYSSLGEPEFKASAANVVRSAVRLGLLLDEGEQGYRVPNAFSRLLESGRLVP